MPKKNNLSSLNPRKSRRFSGPRKAGLFLGKKTRLSKEETKKVKKETNIVRILVIVIILLIFAVLYLFIQLDKIKRSDVGEEVCNEDNIDWIIDNCECVERNIRTCPEGFELEGVRCRKDNDITNSLLECSKYNCTSVIEVEK